MTSVRLKNTDLKVHTLMFLRIGVLSGLFGLANICWSHGGLFLVPSVVVYFLFCMLWNTWGWAGIGHELIHNSPFRAKFFNKLWLWVASFLSLSNKNLFYVTHFAHHNNPHSADDFESPSHINWSQENSNSNFDRYYLVDLHKFNNFVRYTTFNACGFIPAAKLVDFLLRKKRFDGVIWNARMLFVYVAILIAASFAVGSAFPVFLFLVPNFIGTGFVKSLALLQHPTKDLLEAVGITEIEYKGGRYPVRLLDSNFLRDGLDIEMPLWVSFFYANMNYHATHHNRLTLPFFRLPKESEANVLEGRVCRIKIGNCQVMRIWLTAF